MLRHQDLLYRLDVDKLLLGGTYSNENILVRLLADTSIGGLWCAADDQQYVGKWKLDFYINGHRLVPTQTELAPEYQRTYYSDSNVTISKTAFVPITGDRQDIVYVIVEAYNSGAETAQLGVSSEVRFPEVAWVQFVKGPDPSQKRKRVISEQSPSLLITRTVGKDDEVRVIGGALAIAQAQSDSQTASLVFEPVDLAPNQTVVLPFAVAISAYGAEEALMNLAQIENHKAIFAATQETMRKDVVETLQIATPDAMINRAISWAKVNSYRQRTKYPSGYGFTNDPPQDVVVVRDAAWFALGADYFMPDFSKGMLELVAKYGIEAGGKLTEFIQCCEIPPYHYDYDLNINDDTPLFVIAVHHHFVVHRDESFFRRMYPVVTGAVDYILSQRFGGHLVYCTAEEANVWGICSWRNIIPGYSINGAVTEINSECYRALVCAAQMASHAGDEHKAAEYSKEAQSLRDAINAQLVSSRTGYYLLNRDTDGVEHHDLTGDLVFPVMFNVANVEMERRVVDLLFTPMFFTSFGSRTVAVGEKNYDPEFGVRLVGGIWPNLTVWVAYANRKLYPERMVEGMRAAYRICEVDVPKDYKNLVPGEFPECLHGENFESRGMALSPWMPPTYLWLAIEGLLGVEPGIDGIIVEPNLPHYWRWAAARGIACGYADKLSLFVSDSTIYCTRQVKTSRPFELFEDDLSDELVCNTFTMALTRKGQTVVLVAADTTTQVELLIPRSVSGAAADQAMQFTLKSGAHRLLRFDKGELRQ